MAQPKLIKYHYRGGVERGARYTWKDGYSRGEDSIVNYPWLTKWECQHEAKQLGGKAVFIRDGKQEREL